MKRRLTALVLALLMSVSTLVLVPPAVARVELARKLLVGGEVHVISPTLAPHYHGAQAFPTYDYEAVCKRLYKKAAEAKAAEDCIQREEAAYELLLLR